MGMMMSDNESYQETVARLRAESYERNQNNLRYEANRLASEIAELEQQAVDADGRGESDTVDYYMADVQAKSQELGNVLAQLPQPQQQYSQRKLEWAQRRPEIVNSPGFGQTADAWHQYLTQVVGVQDDSDQYADMMTAALEPQGYEPVPSPDELLKTINETSRYCRNKPLTAKTYNKFVEPAQQRVAEQLKAKGKL
jgi:hypothetical protein